MTSLPDLHDSRYKRFTFYFPVGDNMAVSNHIQVPDFQKPGEVKDMHFKYCGQKLKKSERFDQFVETSVPTEFQNRFSKSEKGIDIEICCDALKLASHSKLERMFILTNDDDFIPLCRAVKEFGANISLIHLSDYTTKNFSLLQEVDTFDVVEAIELNAMFVPFMDPTSAIIEADQQTTTFADKPAAEPSDLVVDERNSISDDEVGTLAEP